MSNLTPCPECQRHVRKTETRCPFCGEAVSLAHLPEPALPRRRLSRAATFAFGASVVGATTLGGCTLEDPGHSPAASGSPSAGGAPGGGEGFGGTTSPVYGAPAAGMGNAENGGAPPAPGGAGDGGGPAAGAGGAGGEESGGAGGDAGALTIYGGPPGVGGAP